MGRHLLTPEPQDQKACTESFWHHHSVQGISQAVLLVGLFHGSICMQC